MNANVKPPNVITGMTPLEAAAHWQVRHDIGDLTDDERLQFDEWMRDPGNAVAFDSVQVRWNALSDMQNDELVQSLRAAARNVPRINRTRRLAAGALAASLLVTLGFLGFLGVGGLTSLSARWDHAPRLDAFGVPDFTTAIGESRHAALPDGTTVTLDTDTQIDVAYTDQGRTVRLIQGRAHFTTASDPARPFVVEAGGRRVTAHGTEFDVRLSEDQLLVILAEGMVSVSGQSAEAEEDTLLAPGQQLTAALQGQSVVVAVDVARAMRWRGGYIEFDNDTLDFAITELNRYSPQPVRIDDPRVAELRVSGVFRTGNIERFLSTISEVLPVATDTGRDGSVHLVLAQN